MGIESNFPLPKFVTLGGDCIDGNISGRFDNSDGVIVFTLDISEPDESEDVFVADGVGVRGEVGVEDGTGVADGLGNCPAPQPEIHMPRTRTETIAIHAFVFIFFLLFGVLGCPTLRFTGGGAKSEPISGLANTIIAQHRIGQCMPPACPAHSAGSAAAGVRRMYANILPGDYREARSVAFFTSATYLRCLAINGAKAKTKTTQSTSKRILRVNGCRLEITE